MIIIIIDGRWSENGFMDILKDWMGSKYLNESYILKI